MSVFVSDEIRTIRCTNCGDELTIIISDLSPASDAEQEDLELERAGWEVRELGTFCFRCAPDAPLSHGELIDRRIDAK